MIFRLAAQRTHFAEALEAATVGAGPTPPRPSAYGETSMFLGRKTVTSPMGARVHPVTGGVKPHYGVDVVSDFGAIYAPCAGVVFYRDGGSGGLMLELAIDGAVHPLYAGHKLIVMHMGYPFAQDYERRCGLHSGVLSIWFNGEEKRRMLEALELGYENARSVPPLGMFVDAYEYTVITGEYTPAGSLIGWIGNSGSVAPAPTLRNPFAGAHAHVELRTPEGRAIDPTALINTRR